MPRPVLSFTQLRRIVARRYDHDQFLHVNRYRQTFATCVQDTDNHSTEIKGVKNLIDSVIPFEEAWWEAVPAHRQQARIKQFTRTHPGAHRLTIRHAVDKFGNPRPHYHNVYSRRLPGTKKVDSWGEATSYTGRDSDVKQARVSASRNIPRAPRETWIVPLSDTDTVYEVVSIMDAHIQEDQRSESVRKPRRTWLDSQGICSLLMALSQYLPHRY